MSSNLLKKTIGGCFIVSLALSATASPLRAPSAVSDMPGTLALLGIGLGALTFCGYRFRK